MLLAALAALGAASPDLVQAADDDPVEIQIVDAMNKAFGTHPGFRANHAKGIVVEGSFKASPEAAALSKAALFDGSAIPVTARFSDSSGIPDLPDGSGAANPHGMAIKYHLPDGSDTDMVINSLKFFGLQRRGFPRPAPGAGGEPAGRGQADKIRAVRGRPPDGAGRLRDGVHARQLCR